MATPAPVPAALRGRPFTAAQALELGVTAKMLEGARFRQLLAGVHVCAGSPLSLLVWLRAASLVLPEDATVTHLTALHVRRVFVGPAWPLRFVSQHPHPVRRTGLRVTRGQMLPPRTGRIASAEHCFAVACCVLDLVDAVTAGDWLLYRRHTTLDALHGYVRGHHGPGAPMARRAVAYVRERVESPRESYVRMLLVLAGLPEPRCNPNLGAAQFIGRGDLVYDEYGLLVEYDGRQHAEVADQWEHDLDRLDDFEDATWGCVRVTARRLRRPRAVVSRVHAKLVARGYAGPPPAPGAEWVALFETRTAADRARQAPDRHSWAKSPDRAPATDRTRRR